MWGRLHSSMRHWARLFGGFERPGVAGAVVPAAPERAVVNSAVFDDAEALAAAYDDLAAAYDEIGAKWTVWVMPGQRDAVPLLERAGHVLDAEPEGMVLDLRERTPTRPDDLEDWTADGALAQVGPINDRSYPFGTDSFTRAFDGLSGEGMNIYLAHVDGRPAASVLTVDHEGNSEVQMVAVVPEARGRGLGGKLLSHALADAAERGMETSTLIATKLGRPVYDRLGFEPIGAVQMWEQQRAASVPRGSGGGSPRVG